MPRAASQLSLFGLSMLCGCLQAAPPAVTTHLGMANASAVIAIGEDQFLAASDEDNVLRLYTNAGAPEPSASFDVTAWLGFHGGKIEEADFEGAARIGDVIYWIGSHGRNKDGKNRPARQRLLATRLSTRAGAIQLEPVGPAYGGLLADLAAAPQLARFGLGNAARLSPEKDGGLNIEGLAATPEGGLFIALRSPLAEGKALLVPLLNPAELATGKQARFGEGIQLDLGGQGVRDLVWTGREYFLIAGHPTDGGKQQLYRWAGPGKTPEPLEHGSFKHFNPEAITAYGAAEHPRLLVLSDDGNRKQPEQTADRRFRSFWVEPK
jgi:hypothetical protein